MSKKTLFTSTASSTAAVMKAVCIVAVLCLIFEAGAASRQRGPTVGTDVPPRKFSPMVALDDLVGARPAPSQWPWSPLQIPFTDQKELFEMGTSNIPTLVTPARRILTLQLAYGALTQGTVGDFVETGVYTGGTSILLLKMLQKHDPLSTRKLWACDSFQGLPQASGFDKEDRGNGGRENIRGLFSSSEEVFHQNLRTHGVHDSARLRVLKGWFNETLPDAPIDRIAFLRLDGDIYESTMDALTSLYAKVSPGGLIYADDYYSFTGCKKAVDDFRARHGITNPLYNQAIPEKMDFASNSYIEAVWWIK